MYKIKWDAFHNGILLSSQIPNNDIILPPRPVFFEELDLLGFDKFFNYPKTEEPLLWAIGRKYFQNGICIAEANGGNVFEKPKISIYKHVQLEPINIQDLVDRNSDSLKILEGEAIDFIQDVYKRYKSKIDIFSVAFSGGKDSQVLLDLVTRVLAADEYIVIFNDTTMELPFTHEIVHQTKEKYISIYPNFRLNIVKPKKHSTEYWEMFGPPSRLNRWCCSVYKTIPFAIFYRNLAKKKNANTIVVFEGVRAEESSRRSTYKREAGSVKHLNIINQRVILHWNTSEVFLYLFSRNIEINRGYRYGLTRIGCSVCPFSSEWSEYIINKLYPDLFTKYLDLIYSTTDSLGIAQIDKKRNYIKSGNWKKRAGGKGINSEENYIEFHETDRSIKAIIKKQKGDIREWFKVLGDNKSIVKNNTIIGETRLRNVPISYLITENKENNIISIDKSYDDMQITSSLKKILYKSAFCVKCSACEVECPKGAISFAPNLKIDTAKCINCLHCLDFVERGCLYAKSLKLPIAGASMNFKSSGIDKYSTFGLRKEWLDGFLSNPKFWLENNNLGSKQKHAMNWWLRESMLLTDKNIETDFLNIARRILQKNYNLLWQLIWINLSNNSKIVNWYNTVKYGNYTKNDLFELLQNDFPNLSEGTLRNPLDALINTFDNSPLGSSLMLGMLEKKGNAVTLIKKLGTDEVNPLAILYLLYREAELNNRRSFTVSEFYNINYVNGPYKIFGITQETLKRILRGLQEDKKRIIKVDIVANLDNIFLQDDVSSHDVLNNFE